MIWSLIVGALAGWIASIIMGKNAQMGAIANIIVGLIGGVIGGWVLGLLGFTATGVFSQIIVSVIGAAILLAIVNFFTGRK